MKTVETYGSFEDAIGKSNAAAQDIAQALRRLLFEIYPEITEVPWSRQQVIGYGIGPKKMTEHFCYIGAHDNHANLGLNYGSDLPDPKGMLEGSGKKFRHVKIRRIEDVRRIDLRSLIEAAIQERERALRRKR